MNIEWPESVDEKMARAVCATKEIDPDTLFQQHGYPTDLPIDFTDEKGRKFARAWRKYVPHVRATLRAAFEEMERLGMAKRGQAYGENTWLADTYYREEGVKVDHCLIIRFPWKGEGES